ncbi:tyrosine-type recombinase/integrase [Kineococcus sp. NBC_00420]|uniref:tyrosine-type recombinase/integrase n=1 Tax=Kineococcus sp. NBC_00420 TaxID=2903564 RepID=UPI002E1E27B4
MTVLDLRLTQGLTPSGLPAVRLGEPWLDAYLDFLTARCRPNSVLAAGYDLKVFFTLIAKTPAEVTAADVLGFITAQRTGSAEVLGPVIAVVADADAAGGVSARTVRRRLSSINGFYTFLLARGDITANPVPLGLPTRREHDQPRSSRGSRTPLVRSPRTLPVILNPDEADALTSALRTHRDHAMVAAMLLGGLRRCEVLRLRLEDLNVGARRVFIAEGKGGHQRQIPIFRRFFTHLGDYLSLERPAEADQLGHGHVFCVLKGPRRGHPLSASGLDEVLDGARRRAGLAHVTCHQLRHTCLTRLREAGMALEAIQAQAGHASIESTRIYLHLGDDWLAGQYRRAAEAIDAQAFAGHRTAPPTPEVISPITSTVMGLRGRR